MWKKSEKFSERLKMTYQYIVQSFKGFSDQNDNFGLTFVY